MGADGLQELATEQAGPPQQPDPYARTGTLARNSVLSLAANVVSALVALAAVPLAVRGLGLDSFGVLSVGWILYFSILDLGLGRATTRYVADQIGGGRLHSTGLVEKLAYRWNLLAGTALGAVVAAASPVVATHVLRVAEPELPAAILFLQLMGATIPIAFIATIARGSLEARQRFGLLALLNGASSALGYGIPALAFLGAGLVDIGALLLLSRSVITAGLVIVARTDPMMNSVPQTTRTADLLRFGAWTTVSNVLSPMLVYSDRLIVASSLGSAALGMYVAVSELVTKAWIVPRAVQSVIFPGFAVAHRRQSAAALYARSVGAVAATVMALLAVPLVLRHELLTAWLGSSVSSGAEAIGFILAVGVVTNSIAHVPSAALQAAGRPDLTARLHIIEVIPFVAVAVAGTLTWGLVGTAVAWSLRLIADAGLLFLFATRVLPGDTDGAQVRRLAIVVLGYFTIAWTLPWLLEGLPLALAGLTLAIVASLASYLVTAGEVGPRSNRRAESSS